MSTKKNPYTKNISNADAQLKFGHCTADNEVEAAIIRSGYFHDHYISFGATGVDSRKGGTICKSPGSFQVKAGKNVSSSDNGVFIKAENGNIQISAPSGTIILDARNILIKATGDDQSTGNVTIEGNDKVSIKGKGGGVDISGNASVKITSDKQVDVIGKTILNLYGNIMDCADGSSSSTTPGNPADRAGSKTGMPKVGGAVVSTALSSALSGLGAISGQNNEFNNSLLGSLTSVFGGG
jgi:hypothetical protein